MANSTMANSTMANSTITKSKRQIVSSIEDGLAGLCDDRQRLCFALALWNGNDPILKVAMELERIALQDEYFVSKKLYPNIDFYSGITLKAMGFPTTMFTVLFAVARTVGWIAQWKEMIEDPNQKIGRPRQLYPGAERRDYIPISRRK